MTVLLLAQSECDFSDFLGCLTWNTFGALTSEASAEERVAEKIPAEIRGAKPDTRLITCRTNTVRSTYAYIHYDPSVTIKRFMPLQKQLSAKMWRPPHHGAARIFTSTPPRAGAQDKLIFFNHHLIPTSSRGPLAACKDQKHTHVGFMHITVSQKKL